jgi:hypothetical protein
VAEIEAEARARKVTKSDVFASVARTQERPASLQAIAHLMGSVKGLPADLGANKKEHLEGYGLKRPR